MSSLAVPSENRSLIDRLKREILQLPQIEPETHHHFAHGMYLRRVWSPAGTVIVGKVHKTEHFYAVLTGVVRVTTDDGVRDLNATRDGPQILTCPVGTQRAVYVIEDAWRINVHLNPENVTEIADLEAALVEDDPDGAYLPGNKLKAIP